MTQTEKSERTFDQKHMWNLCVVLLFSQQQQQQQPQLVCFVLAFSQQQQQQQQQFGIGTRVLTRRLNSDDYNNQIGTVISSIDPKTGRIDIKFDDSTLAPSALKAINVIVHVMVCVIHIVCCMSESVCVCVCVCMLCNIKCRRCS